MREPITFSDGWLLTALWAVGQPCDRQRLTEMGDLFGHAVFTDGEVAGSMRHLSEIGFAEQFGPDTYAITLEGKEFVNKHFDNRKGHIAAMFDVIKALGEWDEERLQAIEIERKQIQPFDWEY